MLYTDSENYLLGPSLHQRSRMLLILLHKKFSLINARHIVCFLIELYTAQGISDDVYCQRGSYVTSIANS